jgi:hypothetical protein
MKALICSELCFDKTENDRFQSNSGGVFLTQEDKTINLIHLQTNSANKLLNF